ncbi:MAG: DegT/DnrJ/EryC1/StrS family aminotransferase [Kangiellaceae bacterium]|nr:DegT/DnrJ/EryC1/StrS family aminotransferase [Kangiellaceae bacterium]MCW9000723.1 DegT/DnrJ/EryC1/StrS family aminotransferase [Kangiellaceae bacterium]MCW9017349.1 DegT/DnrJ/EryC1/StrS family aminotransferase [Kangiellaceae bacterium]
MLTALRPVGNYFRYDPKPLDKNLFSPFTFQGYQSGTAALAAALMLAKKKRPEVINPEVILPGYSCPDLLSACKYAGVNVKFVDFEQNLPWMSLSEIESRISSSTIAIVAVNFLGIPERIEQISNRVKSANLLIIEDSAQGFTTGSYSDYWKGDVVTLSFGRGKPLSLFGGGATLCRNQELASLLPNFDNEESDGGLSFRSKNLVFKTLSSPLCYFWLTKLPFLGLGSTEYKPLENLTKLPQDVASQIVSSVEQLRAKLANLKRVAENYRSIEKDYIINLPQTTNTSENSVLLRYPLLITDDSKRDKLFNELASSGLGVSQMYERIIIDIDNIPQEILVDKPDLPNARQFARQLVTLPNHFGTRVEHTRKIKKIMMEKD